MALVFLFIDGIGIGPHEDNPMARGNLRVLNIHSENYQRYDSFGGSLKPIDACLGLPGLPQSATGQTSIFTGRNAALAINRHLSGFPSPTLRAMLREDSILKRVAASPLKAVFANAFTPAYFLFPINRMSASTLHMLYAGLKPRWIWQIAEGEALFQDFTNELLLKGGMKVESLTPAGAGALLAEMAERYQFITYEYFLTDAAGHGRIATPANEILDNLDAMLASLLESLDLDRHSVLLCSDHGNIEAASESHTRNPVPLIAWGPGASELLLGVEDITHIKESVIRFLGID